MPKKRHRRRKFETRRCYAYINEDGSQFFPDKSGYGRFDEIADEDIPEDVEVEEFWVDIRVLPAQYTMNSEQAVTNAAIEAQMKGKGSDGAAAKASLDVTFQQMMMAIAAWSLEDEEGKPVECNRDALESLQPAWLYEFIQQAYGRVNNLSKNWQTA